MRGLAPLAASLALAAVLAAPAHAGLTWWTPAKTERHLVKTGVAWSFTDTGEPQIDRILSARCTGIERRNGTRYNKFRCLLRPARNAHFNRPYYARLMLGASSDEILILFLRWA